MEKPTWYEIVTAGFITIFIAFSLIYILVEQSRGYIFHAFNISNLLIVLLFIPLLTYPRERIKYKIETIDKVVSILTSISLMLSSLVTILLWGTAVESQKSLLDIIKNYDWVYYISFLMITLGSLYSALKPVLLWCYNKNIVHITINGLDFTAKKVKKGLKGKLTGTTSANEMINYTETKDSASSLIDNIKTKYPDIEPEAINAFLLAAKKIK